MPRLAPPALAHLPRPKLIALRTALTMARADLALQASLFGLAPEQITAGLERTIADVERAVYSIDTQEPESDYLAQQEFNRAAHQQQRLEAHQEQVRLYGDAIYAPADDLLESAASLARALYGGLVED